MKRLLLLSAVALTTASMSAQAARDDIIHGMVLEPPHLDPTAGAAAAIDEVVYANVFQGLTGIDRTGAVQPALATSWTVSDDGLTYVFTLADGVKFHDGADFSATDVAFSFSRAMAADSVNAQKALFEPIFSVEGSDSAGTVTIKLKRPTGNFLFNLGWGDAVIVDPASADSNKTAPVGTGPFKFDKWVNGDRVELSRNEAYWGEPAKLASATFKFISDPNAGAAALMAGDVDAFSNIQAPELVAQFEADPRFTVAIGSTEGETVLSTNNGKAPWSDIRVRQAIAHTLNREEIILGSEFGYGTPIGSHFAPHHPAYQDLTGTYPLDVERAKALLAEAGYADGIKGSIKLPPPSYARRSGEIIAAQLRAVGIELEIIPVEWGQWLSDVFKATDYDLTIVSHTEPMDIGIYARGDYYFNYDSAEMKATMAALNEESDQTKRYRLMTKAQQIIADDAVNGFLFQLAKRGVWNSQLRGLWQNSPTQANDLTEVYWAE